MYNAGPRAAFAWRALFTRVFVDCGVDVEIVEHRWPQPIEELWARDGLCAAFMCGWPFVRSPRAMQAIAAPVPAPERYVGLPRYCSEFLVRADSKWSRLEDTFGHRFGWMARDSQSGFNAPRAHLAKYVSAKRPTLYAESVGPLGNPARAIAALTAGEVDVIALDSFYLDLVRVHDPAKLEAIECVATTEWMPIPLLVASPDVPGRIVQTLRMHLLQLHERADCLPLLEQACLRRFVVPDVGAYRVLEDRAREAVRRGYEAIR